MLGTPEEEDQSLGEPTCIPPQLLSPREQVFLEISILRVKNFTFTSVAISELLVEAQLQGRPECWTDPDCQLKLPL